jgi:long-chain acyl-CoA synthetase
LVSVVIEAAREFGARPALCVAEGGPPRFLSYAGLWQATQRGAQALVRAGLRPGDRVLLLAEPSPQWVAALFALLHARCIAVPVILETPVAALEAIAGHAGVSAVICSQRSRAMLQQSARLLAARPVAIETLFEPELVEVSAVAAPDPELALLAFTSGSTRMPLAVQLTHANLLADLAALRQVRRAGPEHGFLSMLPPAHLFELMGGILGPLSCGARIVFPGSRLPNRLVDCLREEHITHACCVPALLHCLYDEVMDELIERKLVDPARRGQTVEETARRFESEADEPTRDRIVNDVRARIGATLHTLVLGGAALDPAWDRLLRVLGIQLEVGYGLTEASPIVSLGLASTCPPGSVGHPLPGVDVCIDASGEIRVRGPTVTTGYFRNPEATLEALDHEGWLRTGDHGTLDAAGFLFIRGRLKEAIVTAAGETIYPEEAEGYYASPLFAESCVAGVPGPLGNDVPVLFVVPAEPAHLDADLEAEFRRLRGLAPARLRAERVVRLDAPLPRTALGKPRRRAIAAAWANRTAQPKPPDA